MLYKFSTSNAYELPQMINRMTKKNKLETIVVCFEYFFFLLNDIDYYLSCSQHLGIVSFILRMGLCQVLFVD